MHRVIIAQVDRVLLQSSYASHAPTPRTKGKQEQTMLRLKAAD